MDDVIITKHAERRLQQRAIKLAWVQQVIKWGAEKYEKGGYYKYFLGKKQASLAKKIGVNVRHCLGLTVVILAANQSDMLITVYWDTSSSKKSWGRK